MKGTESGKEKVKKICDLLRRETLEPAKEEAEQMIGSAKRAAEEILAEGKLKAEKLLEEAKREVQLQKNVFQSSLQQACRQALEALKQKIENRLLNKELLQLLSKKVQEPQVLADLIEAVLKALKEEKTKGDLSVYIPSAVPARSVNALLAQNLLEQLKEKGVLLGGFAGGVEIKLHDANMTIDLSLEVLRELVAQYIRKDFRELIFSA